MSVAAKNMKMCVTCAYYNGERRPYGGTFVEYDSNRKGKCYRTFQQGIEKNPMWSCSDWELWAPINK